MVVTFYFVSYSELQLPTQEKGESAKYSFILQSSLKKIAHCNTLSQYCMLQIYFIKTLSHTHFSIYVDLGTGGWGPPFSKSDKVFLLCFMRMAFNFAINSVDAYFVSNFVTNGVGTLSGFNF